MGKIHQRSRSHYLRCAHVLLYDRHADALCTRYGGEPFRFASGRVAILGTHWPLRDWCVSGD